MSRKFNLIAMCWLAIMGLVATFGVIYLSIEGREPPQILVILVSTAVGALAGMFSQSQVHEERTP